jgi:small subunit ribosomal protein S1
MSKEENYQFSAEAPPDDSWWAAILSDVEFDGNNVGEALLEIDEENSSQSIDWERAERLYKQDQIIELRVTGFNRGGLLVEDEHIKGFVPLSHLTKCTDDITDEKQKDILKSYLDCSLDLKVIECSPRRERVVLSERAALAAPGKRIELLKKLENGARASGKVTTITKFGAFVDLGGIEGLIHISELSWGRVTHPSEVLTQGQEIDVQVLNLDHSRCRVALSLKRLQSNPWETAHLHYQIGAVAEATITNIVPYGAFARLEEGLDGLIHISEIDGNPDNPAEVLKEGQKVQVSILHIDTARQQLGLHLDSISGE